VLLDCPKRYSPEGYSPEGYSPEGYSPERSLLSLLQLVSPALPVGAYSYSEGLETLVQQARIINANDLYHWLQQSLTWGAIRLEAGVMIRSYRCVTEKDWAGLEAWNDWLSAARETEELRHQSWQMGRSLLQLLQKLTQPLDRGLVDLSVLDLSVIERIGQGNCNFAVAYAIAASQWNLEGSTALLGYLQAWAANLVSAGVRLIPLGQTQGQQVLFVLQPDLVTAAQVFLTLANEDLRGCNWGLSLASMAHETQYSRLFRS
jgi:urease accessory protein